MAEGVLTPGVPGGSAANAQPRLLYLDNLKLVLTILVIAHHAAITYGAAGSWFYVEPAADPLTALLLTIFAATNQSYFMGLYFFISGFFTPGSLRRKGTTAFLKDRFVRLGIPLLAFGVFIAPLLTVVASAGEVSYGVALQAALAALPDMAPGPLWFVGTLLGFSVAYAALRPLLPPVSSHASRVPQNRHLWALAAGLIVLTFAVRQVFPIGVEVLHLQLGYFPQYVALFALGAMAGQRGWLQGLPVTLLRTWLPVVGAVFVAMPLVALAGGAMDPANLSLFRGGWHWQALAQSVLENLHCVGIATCLLLVFRERGHVQGPLARAAGADSYAVYVIHAPVLVAIAVGMRPLAMHPLAKFALLSLLATVACFLLSHYLIRRWAFVRKVL